MPASSSSPAPRSSPGRCRTSSCGRVDAAVHEKREAYPTRRLTHGFLQERERVGGPHVHALGAAETVHLFVLRSFGWIDLHAVQCIASLELGAEHARRLEAG